MQRRPRHPNARQNRRNDPSSRPRRPYPPNNSGDRPNDYSRIPADITPQPYQPNSQAAFNYPDHQQNLPHLFNSHPDHPQQLYPVQTSLNPHPIIGDQASHPNSYQISGNPLSLFPQFDLTQLINDYNAISAPIIDNSATFPSNNQSALTSNDAILAQLMQLAANIIPQTNPNIPSTSLLQKTNIQQLFGSGFVPPPISANDPYNLGTLHSLGESENDVDRVRTLSGDYIPVDLVPLFSSVTVGSVVGCIKDIISPYLENISSVHLLKGYLVHPAPAVRMASLEAIVKLHTSALASPLDGHLYAYIVPVLNDPNPDVRVLAASLVRHISNVHPSFPVPACPDLATSMNSTTVNLVDDAFSRVSVLVQDPEWQVRFSCALELGYFTEVSLPLLLQSLSKKLLKDDGTAVKNPPRGVIRFTCEWMPFAGAFVHAMEDDRQEVRLAALDAIGRLANSQDSASVRFSQKAVTFLLDMTNDEAASVRTRALSLLFTVSDRTPVQLSETDLGDMGDLFIDPSLKMRLDLYRFLGTVVCADSIALRCLVVELRRSIDRFGCAVSVAMGGSGGSSLSYSASEGCGELVCIMACFRGVAERNTDLVAAEMNNILKLDSRFLRVEVRPSDVHHAALVILIYNAALRKPEYMRKLPLFIRRQVNLFRHRYPGSLPPPTLNSFASKDLSKVSPNTPIRDPEVIVTQSMLVTLAGELRHILVAPAISISGLEAKLVAVRKEWASLPNTVVRFDTLHMLIDIGALLLAALDASHLASELRRSASELACRYHVIVDPNEHHDFGSTLIKSEGTGRTSMSPIPSSKPVNPLESRTDPLMQATIPPHSSRPPFSSTDTETGKWWSTLWIAASNATHPADDVLTAIRHTLAFDLFKCNVTRLDWSLSVDYCFTPSKRIGYRPEDPAPRIPPGFPLELKLKVAFVNSSLPSQVGFGTPPGSRNIFNTNSVGQYFSKAPCTSVQVPTLQDHDYPVVVQIEWPHGAQIYQAFRSRPCLITGEEHAQVRVGPRSWTAPSALSVTVGWLVGNEQLPSMKVKSEMARSGGSLAMNSSYWGETGLVKQAGVSGNEVNMMGQFVPATNTDMTNAHIRTNEEDDFVDDNSDDTVNMIPTADLEISENEAEELLNADDNECGGIILGDQVASCINIADADQPADKKRKLSQKEKSKERKKHKFAEELDRAILKEHSPMAQAENMARQLLDYTLKDRKMTSLEVEDRLLPESHFLDISMFTEVNDSKYPELIRCAVPDLDNHMLTAHNAKPRSKITTKSSLRKLGPLVLILCTSGMRCMDVIRALRPLTGDADFSRQTHGPWNGRDQGASIKFRIGKLFAKHIKLDDQVEFLKGYPVHIAVGTPNRVARLLKMGALKTSNLKCIVLDASYRDGKLRTLFTAAESRSEFFALYMEWLVRLCKNEELPILMGEPSISSTGQSLSIVNQDVGGKDETEMGESQSVQCYRIDQDDLHESLESKETSSVVPGAQLVLSKSKKLAKLEARRQVKVQKQLQAMSKSRPPLMCMF